MQILKFIKHLIFISFFLLNACTQTSINQEAAIVPTVEQYLIPSIQVISEPRYYGIQERMQHYKVPGMSIAIIKNGQIELTRGYGYAQQSKGIVVNQQTRFKAGSISKSITAVLVMKLVEKGVLDLKTDIKKYLKSWQLPTNKYTVTPITLSMLLSHTSGLKNINSKGYKQDVELPSLNDRLDGKGNTPPITFEHLPNTVFSYANPGYAIIEKIIEDVTGQSFADLVKVMIFEPLKMEHSSFEILPYTPQDTTKSYAYNRQGALIDGYWYNSSSKAVGGLWSTATDLAKFYIALQQSINGKNDFLSQEKAQALISYQKGDYGFGFYLKGKKEQLIFSHSGKSVGYTSYLIGYAHQSDGVVILTNADNGGYLFSEIIRGISMKNNWNFMQPKMIETIELSQQLLTKYVGTYRFKSGNEDYTLVLKQAGKHLMLIDKDEAGESIFTIRAMTDSTFIDINEGDEFVMREGEHQELLLIWNKAYVFKKLMVE